MKRAEYEWAEVPYPETVRGQVDETMADDHDPHVFLYVPDISMETGWSTHRVPERRNERARRNPVGFHR